MSATLTSGLSVELPLRVIDVKYPFFTLLLSHGNQLFRVPNPEWNKLDLKWMI